MVHYLNVMCKAIQSHKEYTSLFCESDTPNNWLLRRIKHIILLFKLKTVWTGVDTGWHRNFMYFFIIILSTEIQCHKMNGNRIFTRIGNLYLSLSVFLPLSLSVSHYPFLLMRESFDWLNAVLPFKWLSQRILPRQ